MTCECLSFARDYDLVLRCVDCGTALADVADGPVDEPDPDDIGGLRYWQARVARIEAVRNSPDALLASIEDDDAILARARMSPPFPGSLAEMCIHIARDRRRQTIETLARVETDAVFARLSGRRPD